MPPRIKQPCEARPVALLPADVVGVIAAFLSQTTEQQRSLMLVSNTWYRGVIEQDGMKPKPGVFWPWCALKERQPSSVTVSDSNDEALMQRLTETLPAVSELKVQARVEKTSCIHVEGLKHLTSLMFLSGANSLRTLSNLLTSLTHLGHSLTTLAITSSKTGDADMEFLASHFPHLTSLDLLTAGIFQSASKVTDAGLRVLSSRLKNLQVLKLQPQNEESMTDVGVEHLAQGCPHLKTLYLQGSSVSATGIKYLTNMGDLTTLCLRSCKKVDDAAMISIGRVEKLQWLNVSFCHHTTPAGEIYGITPVGFKALHNKSFKALIAERTHLSDACLEHIAGNLPQLEQLEVRSCRYVSNVGLQHIATMKHLVDLNIEDVGKEVNSDGLAFLANITTLQRFAAPSTQLTDDVVGKIVKSNTGLHFLDLRRTRITDDAMVSVANNCPRLTSLDVSACTKITNEGLLVLCDKLLWLQTLSVASLSLLTSDGFARITQLEELSSLTMNLCRNVSDVVMEDIRTLPKLRKLNAFGCGGNFAL